MDGNFGVDEFGREHFIVEAPRGRLGISLRENERGFVVIRGLDPHSPADMNAWEAIDRRRVQLIQLSVQVGDRIVAIEGQDVVHCSLQEIVTRLSKLSSMTRRLTLARYHETAFQTSNFDVEKLVLARVPSGPLGLQINECIPYGAFVEDFQRLADGSMTKLASHPKLHRGCQIINVNGKDVSSSPREQVVALLGSLKDQEKEVVFYRATGARCTAIFSVDSSVSERHLGFTIDETESMRCVITSVGPRGDPAIGLGDVLIGVNTTDITTMPHKEAIAVVKDTPLPRQLYFARHQNEIVPECHVVQIGPGPLGVNLDGEMRNSARITGFTTIQDAERPEFNACAPFVPGSYVLSICSLSVVDHDLTAISSLLVKLKQSSKTILIGNRALLDTLRGESVHAKIVVPKGPLGINFNGGNPDSASISGYYASPVDGSPGVIESSGRIPIGAVLQRINAMNVSCLPLAHVSDLLKKLSDVPKELVFHRGDSQQDVNTRVVDVRLPAGPLGIDLKSSIANKVIVDKLNSDPARGSTRVSDHGGVVEGSEIVAIDGFDVSKLELSDVLELLKLLATHEKVITFRTTRTAYEQMLDPVQRPRLVRIEVPATSSLSLNTEILDQAVLASDLQAVPVGSRLVGINNVDVRCLSLQQIVATMLSLQNGVHLDLRFDTIGTRHIDSLSLLTNAAPSVAVDAVAPSPPSSPDGNAHHQMALSPSPPPNVANTPQLISPLTSIALPPSDRGSSSLVAPSPPTSVQPSSALSTPHQMASSLGRLSIRTMEASRSGAESGKLECDKQQSQPSPTTDDSKFEYLINMQASWMGSRSLYRLVLDVANHTLDISPVKATSPRPGKSSGIISLQLNEITALDCGASRSGASPQRSAAPPSLFRSSSATLNSDGSERATVILTTATKKSIEFDMRSVADRTVFATRMQSLIPALQPPSSG